MALEEKTGLSLRDTNVQVDRLAKSPAKPLSTPNGKNKENASQKQQKISGFFTPKAAKPSKPDTPESNSKKGQASLLSFFSPKNAKPKSEVSTEKKEKIIDNKNSIIENSKKIDESDETRIEPKEVNATDLQQKIKRCDVKIQKMSATDIEHYTRRIEEDKCAEDDEKNEVEEEAEKSSSSSEEESESDWEGDSDDGFKKAANKPKPKKLVKKKGAAGRQRAALNAPIVIPGAMKSELSAYEKLRDDNIKAREDMLAALMADFQSFKNDSGIKAKENKPKKKRTFDDAFQSSGFMPLERRKSSRLVDKPEDEAEKLKEADGDDAEDYTLKDDTPKSEKGGMPMSTTKVADQYNMHHRRRGRAFVFNHLNFDPQLNLKKRDGTNCDRDNLRITLRQLDFDVEVHDDLPFKDIERILESASMEDHSEADCILVAVLSHGELGILYARYTTYFCNNKYFSKHKNIFPVTSHTSPTVCGLTSRRTSARVLPANPSCSSSKLARATSSTTASRWWPPSRTPGPPPTRSPAMRTF